MEMFIITFIGLVTVFLIFFILYFVFLLFGFFSKKASMKLPKKIHSQEVTNEKNILLESEESEEEIAAVMAAIYALMGSNIRIISVSKKNRKREWTFWKKTGWRGVKGWSESSRLE